MRQIIRGQRKAHGDTNIDRFSSLDTHFTRPWPKVLWMDKKAEAEGKGGNGRGEG